MAITQRCDRCDFVFAYYEPLPVCTGCGLNICENCQVGGSDYSDEGRVYCYCQICQDEDLEPYAEPDEYPVDDDLRDVDFEP